VFHLKLFASANIDFDGWMNRMWKLPVTLTALLALWNLQQIQGHFTLVGSREKAAYPSDNRRFFPIGPSTLETLRPVRDCAQLPPVTPILVGPNEVHRFQFEIGNGASHIGPCEAFAVIGATSSKLNEEKNCVSKEGSFMDVTFPALQPGTRGYLKMKVKAVHISEDKPEYYDSCVDFVIAGGAAKSAAGAQESYQNQKFLTNENTGLPSIADAEPHSDTRPTYNTQPDDIYGEASPVDDAPSDNVFGEALPESDVQPRNVYGEATPVYDVQPRNVYGEATPVYDVQPRNHAYGSPTSTKTRVSNRQPRRLYAHKQYPAAKKQSQGCVRSSDQCASVGDMRCQCGDDSVFLTCDVSRKYVVRQMALGTQCYFGTRGFEIRARSL
jgi:hypothetical protein